MSELKCPFCQQELQETYDGKQFWCSNYKDPTHPINMLGTKELWQELITTRKALDVAMNALKRIAEPQAWSPIYAESLIAKDALEQINEIKGG